VLLTLFANTLRYISQAQIFTCAKKMPAYHPPVDKRCIYIVNV